MHDNKNKQYIGNVIDGVKHGVGILQIDSKVFKGEFVHGKRTGFGVFQDLGSNYNGFNNNNPEFNVVDASKWLDVAKVNKKGELIHAPHSVYEKTNVL